MRWLLPVCFLFSLVLIVGIGQGPLGLLSRHLEAPPGHFLLLRIEARTVFDQPHSSLHGLDYPEWTGDHLIFRVPALDRLTSPPVRLLYEVRSPEDVVAVEMTAVRSLSHTVHFPLQRSVFSEVAVLLRAVSGEGEVFLELYGDPLVLAPMQEKRIGVVRDPSGGLQVYREPDLWQDRLEEALVRAEPAVVLVLCNEGWVEHSRVKSPEEVVR